MKSLYYIFGICLFLFATVCSGQWTQEKNYPGGPTDAVIQFGIGDTVYIGGGSAGSTGFYKFDPSTNTWTRKADIPQRAFGVSFSIGSKGYVGLGQSDPQGTGQQSVSNDLWEYNPTQDIWTQKTNLPGAARDAAFAFVIGNKAYVGGGTDANYRVYSDFYSYDPALNKWDTLNALPDYLYFNSTFVIGKYGYVATGANATTELTSLWRYDPSSDSWDPMSDFPGAARQSAVSFSNNRLGYVGLGQSQYTSVFKDFYVYDPDQDLWSAASHFPGSNGRGWAAGVATSSAAFLGLGTYFSGNSLVGNNDFWKLAFFASVSSPKSKPPVQIFPNPATDFISIMASPTSSIQVRSSIGSLCLSRAVPSDGKIDISTLPSGIYEIEVTAPEGHCTARFIKE